MSFETAKADALDTTNNVLGGNSRNDPVAWNVAVALFQISSALDDRLSAIERQQRQILQTLEQLRSDVGYLKR